MRIPVVENTLTRSSLAQENAMDGTNATSVRKMAPNSVIRLLMRERYYAVGLPGRMPWMKPPFCWICLETSSGLNWMVA